MREFFLAHVAFSVVTMTLLAALWGGQSAMWKLTLNGIKWGVGIVGLLFLLSSQVWLFWAGQVLPAEIPLPPLLLLASYYATALIGVSASALAMTSLPGSAYLGLPSR